MKNYDTIKKEAQIFLSQLFDEFNSLKMNLEENFLDHICYRCETDDEYILYKKIFLNHGKLLIESLIGGRMIATFKLNEPILFNERMIDVVELPSPKTGRSYGSGFEHAEFVIRENFESFAKKFPEVEFDYSAIEKKHNAELRIKFKDQLSVKFHHKSLEEVIEIEKESL